MLLSNTESVNLTEYRHVFQLRSLSLSFHVSDDIYELFSMDDQFRECPWYQTKWHGSTFECISSVSSLRIQVVTSSELWDRRIHEIKWSTGCWERLSSFIVWGIQAFATSTMVKSGQSFDQWWTLEQDMYYGSRYQGESVLPCMETSSDTDLRHILLLMNIIEYTDLIKFYVLLFLVILFESVPCVRFSTLGSSSDFSVVCVSFKIHVSSSFHLRNVRH